jgi:hypothetical protein
MNDLNSDGQPRGRGISWTRLEDSRMDELIGLCRGLIADGSVVYEEAHFLLIWLRRNVPVQRTFVGGHLSATLERLLANGNLGADGEGELVDLLMKVIGGTPLDIDNASYSTSLPLDDPPPAVPIEGQSFCFTGKFHFGSRDACQHAVKAAGGSIHANPRKDTCFLIIGDIGSRDWAHSSMGRKIERAVELREKGLPIKIICESHWAKSIRAAAHAAQ